jgi:hypothetical protein
LRVTNGEQSPTELVDFFCLVIEEDKRLLAGFRPSEWLAVCGVRRDLYMRALKLHFLPDVLGFYILAEFCSGIFLVPYRDVPPLILGHGVDKMRLNCILISFCSKMHYVSLVYPKILALPLLDKFDGRFREEFQRF